VKLTLQIWRQRDTKDPGHYETFEVDQLDVGMSLLEMLDRLNEQLVHEGKEAIAFDSDCRESICGTCGVNVNGRPHGPRPHVTSCMQRLRSFRDGETVRIEPLRSGAFPVRKDLVVDRSGLDRIIAAGGTVALPAGTAPDSDAVGVGHDQVERALDFAACIGCGACVSACPNGAAVLFTGAKVAHLSMLPIPAIEKVPRAEHMVAAMEDEFGPCSQYGECALVCPQNVPLTAIAFLQKERLKSLLHPRV
jgi:succinate dehydrogenase / fumarate reductase iron-sulfur subunit